MDFKQIEETYWGGKSQELVDFYWNWPLGRQRSAWFAKYLKDYKFNSVFEVGIFGGRNLKYIKDLHNLVKIGGLDINKPSVEFAKTQIIDGYFYNLSASDIDKVEDNYDVIFTMGVMIHLAPDMIIGVIEKMLSKTNKYIFHIEQFGNGQIINGPQELNPQAKITNKIRWAPNFINIYRSLGYEVEVKPLPKSIIGSDCSHIIKVIKK